MRSKSSSNIKFFALATGITLTSSIALASAWPQMRNIANARAVKLVGEAQSANPAESATDFKLATWLNPANQSAQFGLARTQILAGHPDAALTTLERAGEGSESSSLRLRTLIELGRTQEAADRAHDLLATNPSNADVLLAALAYSLAGRTADASALTPLVTSPEAAQRISRAASGNLPLAQELYASGLPESSRTLAMKQPVSFERNVLLARIAYARHTAADLTAATQYLESAVALNPSDTSAHRLLANVYADRQLTAQSSVQSALSEKLDAGKP